MFLRISSPVSSQNYELYSSYAIRCETENNSQQLRRGNVHDVDHCVEHLNVLKISEYLY